MPHIMKIGNGQHNVCHVVSYDLGLDCVHLLYQRHMPTLSSQSCGPVLLMRKL